MSGFNPGDHVLVIEPNPAAGRTGTIVCPKPIPAPEGYSEDGWIVRLDEPLFDNGRVVVYDDQIQHVNEGAR